MSDVELGASLSAPRQIYPTGRNAYSEAERPRCQIQPVCSAHDEKLIRDAANYVRPGGVMLLTSPNANYRPITTEDEGPLCVVSQHVG
jgi:hypothetical protein